MAQWAKPLLPKLDDLSSIPRTRVKVEEQYCTKLFSDLHMQAVACACHTPYYTLIINKNCKSPNTQVTWETELSCKPEGKSVPPLFTSCIWTTTSESPTVSQNGTPIWGPSVQAHEAGGGTLHVQWDNVRWHGWCLQSESSCIFFSPTSARLEAF